MIQMMIQQRGMSQYLLSKTSGIPYATINDICNGRTQLKKCSAGTVYRLSHALDVSTKTLLEPYMQKHTNFELFKSSICHRLKEISNIAFMIDLLKSRKIQKYPGVTTTDNVNDVLSVLMAKQKPSIRSELEQAA